MRSHGIEQPTPLQMLSWLGRRTMGALTYRPESGPDIPDVTLVDLDRVQAAMLERLGGPDVTDERADQLIRIAGTGAGGARPKITAAYTDTEELVPDTGSVPPGAVPWLVKFHTADDPVDLSAIEATYLQMAAAAGVTTCEHRLLTGSSGARYLAVRRFDRSPVAGAQPRRIHMATAAGLLEAYPEHGQHIDYDTVIRATRQVTGDIRDVIEVVRRAAFNVVAHNRDDHARNIAFLWTGEHGWRLAPAYDLTYSVGPRPAYLSGEAGEHYLDVAGKGARISRADLRTLARAADLKPSEVDDIVDQTVAAVAQWPQLATANRVADAHVAEIAARLPALDR
jgi:serine/threonine-protein kinase HipA